MSSQSDVRRLILAIALAVAVFPSAHVTSQAQTAAPRKWTPPRTAWGHPDLQGMWANGTLTPLERPKELAGKPMFTEEEARRAAEERIQRGNRDLRAQSPEADVSQSYNEFWSDPKGVYLNRRTSLIIDPPDGRFPALTEEGRKRADALAANRRQRPASWEDFGVWERCLTRGMPRLSGSYNNNYQILQTPGYVVILAEMIHEARIIPLEGRPLGNNIRQWMGHSQGRWEGDTLIVETSNFNGRAPQRDAFSFGIGVNGRVIERFTRIDASTIDYQFTIDDPDTYMKPLTIALPMYGTAEQIFEYACHEGNYGLAGILSGARAEEKASEGK